MCRFSLFLVVVNSSFRKVYKFILGIIHLAHTYNFSGGKNVSFTINFVFVLNKWYFARRDTNVSHTAKVHLELSQTSKIEPFMEMVSGFEALTIFAKSSFLDVWLSSK